MKTRLILPLIIFLASAAFGRGKSEVEVTTIWDNGTHAAFTSLIKFKGHFYCSFREGYSHIFDEEGRAEGKVRILQSRNGRRWKSVALIGCEGIDLRDPKLSVTPDGRLMITIGGSVYRERRHLCSEPMVCFSSDGRHFSAPQPIEIDERARTTHDWVWRVTWHEDTGYGVSYSSARRDTLALLRTSDGLHYDLLTKLPIRGFPNETTLRFTPDGKMLMMVRRDDADTQGYWAVSPPPYTDWQFSPMGFRIGGQDFILYDNQILLATRTYFTRHCKTALFRGTLKGDWDEVFVLPSGGDTSYPGLLVEGDRLWVSYYTSASQSGKACIRLARLPLSLFKDK